MCFNVSCKRRSRYGDNNLINRVFFFSSSAFPFNRKASRDPSSPPPPGGGDNQSKLRASINLLPEQFIVIKAWNKRLTVFKYYALLIIINVIIRAFRI